MTAFQRKRMLRAIAKPAPVLTTDGDLEQVAARVYPDAPGPNGWSDRAAMRSAWTMAVAWMRDRPDGSIWVIDRGSRAPGWKAVE